MRARNIKPGFFANETLAECQPLARLLFVGLWCAADKYGRLEDRPKRLKAELLPYDNCELDDLLNELEMRGFIIRYEQNSLKCIQILRFRKHQKPHPNEVEFPIPTITREMFLSRREIVIANREKVGITQAECGMMNDDMWNDLYSTETKPTKQSSETAVLEFPCDGNTSAWCLTQSQLDAWRAMFPALDLLSECRSALAWVLANPDKRKTARGMPRFLVGWFDRSQNKSKGRQGGNATSALRLSNRKSL